MNAKLNKLVTITTTPKRLRQIANALERSFNDSTVGDDVPVHDEYGLDGLIVRFKVDQNEMWAEKRQGAS